jgi:hypothetical protein
MTQPENQAEALDERALAASAEAVQKWLDWCWHHGEGPEARFGATVAVTDYLSALPEAPAVPVGVTDAIVKRAAWEYLSHKGERPERIKRSGYELWEEHAPAIRAALEAALQSSPPVQTAEGQPCDDCGRPSLVWFAPNDLWNRVQGGPDATDDPGGMLCPYCFIMKAEKSGVKPTAWIVCTEAIEADAPVKAAAVDGPRVRQIIFDALDLSEELRIECTADVVNALTEAGALASQPAVEGEAVATVHVYESATCNGRKMGSIRNWESFVKSLPVGDHPLFLRPAAADAGVRKALTGFELRSVIYDALDLSEELRIECTDAVVAALAAKRGQASRWTLLRSAGSLFLSPHRTVGKAGGCL